jgi:hypothetical protein
VGTPVSSHEIPKRAHLQEELKVAMCTASPCGPHVHCQIFVVFLARVGIKVLYPL